MFGSAHKATGSACILGHCVDTLDDFAFAKTGLGTLAGRCLRSSWQPVYRAQDLATGRAVPLTIMGECFTLYRGESGTPHAVAFRCAHRGTQLSTGWVEEDCIRFLYQARQS